MRTFEVNILGQRYKMRSDEGEEYLNSLARFVNEKIGEVQKGAKTVATHNLAILAALNIADSLFKLREQEAQAKKEVRERVRRILKLVRVGLGNVDSSAGREEENGFPCRVRDERIENK